MKRILIILAIIILAAAAGIFYLNKTVLPTKIRAAIITGLEDVTRKKVLLGSVRFNIFKGIVLKDLIIRDELNAIINVREARCGFMFTPLFNKQIMISRLILESPEIFIERRADNSVNVLELFSKERMAETDFKIFIQRISIRKAAVIFHDLTLEPLYSKEIKSLDADIRILLSGKVSYVAAFDIPSDLYIKVDASGEYSINDKELTSEIKFKNFMPKEFLRYYGKTGLSFPEGSFDSAISLKYKADTISIESESRTEDLAISTDDLFARISGEERSSFRYNFTEKKLSYAGSVNILDMSIDGIEYIDTIDSIKGRIEFSNMGISSDNITAIALDLPVEAKINISDFNNPVLNIAASSDVRLAAFQKMLKDEFEFNIPADLSGDAKLLLAIRYPVLAPETLRISGSLYMQNASADIGGGKAVLENLTGQFKFLPNQVSWDDVGFLYRDERYTSSGALTDFKNPGIQLKLSSKDIALDTIFALNGKVANFSKFSGKYLNSDISGAGAVDFSNPARIDTDMDGSVNVDAEDLKKPLEKFKDKFERIKPKGIVRARFSLKGDLKNLKACAIDANLSSDSISLYGLKLATSTMNYSQKNGSGDILFMRSFFYGGSMSATGRIEWTAKDTPYRLDIGVDRVRIEKFKADTAFKDKDIAGSIKMNVKLNGLFNDIGKLTGEGKAMVTAGKLWQLNLFRGLGALLFTSDFSEVIFKEAYCGFTIRDREAFTDELMLKSDLVNIYGPLKIGFNNSVNAVLKAEFSKDALEAGARQNIVTALGKYSLIDVHGTLKEPLYNIRPDVGNIVESIAERFFSE
ncbi:MAG: hypothetical protein Q7S07_04325 [Candidatus Omnitrophota bacterium]|nr:hypothetical protein [Candidatus Omnitrophota bacterium]